MAKESKELSLLKQSVLEVQLRRNINLKHNESKKEELIKRVKEMVLAPEAFRLLEKAKAHFNLMPEYQNCNLNKEIKSLIRKTK